MAFPRDPGAPSAGWNPGPADTWGCAEHLSPPAAGWARLCTGGERPVWQTGWRAERAGASAVGPSCCRRRERRSCPAPRRWRRTGSAAETPPCGTRPARTRARER